MGVPSCATHAMETPIANNVAGARAAAPLTARSWFPSGWARDLRRRRQMQNLMSRRQVVLALFFASAAVSCAKVQRDGSADGSSTGLAGTGSVTSRSFAGSGASSNSAGPGNTNSAAASSAPSACAGPGVHGYGKGNPRLECCAGTSAFYLKEKSYDEKEERVCVSGPDGGAFACIRGTCGDGICEPGEDQPCGCVSDCPSAAWEGTYMPPAGGLNGMPTSCSKDDIVARLSVSGTSTDCGDLALDATAEAKQTAMQCARDRYYMNQPFQVFWRTQGTDSVDHHGIYATSGMSGALLIYALEVDANVFSINEPGATAAYWRCSSLPGAACTGTIDQCLECTPMDPAPVCDCLPAGPRPGTADGTMVEIHCLTTQP